MNQTNHIHGPAKVTITKNSQGHVTIEIRSGTNRQILGRVKMNPEDFTEALFGLARCEGEMEIRPLAAEYFATPIIIRRVVLEDEEADQAHKTKYQPTEERIEELNRIIIGNAPDDHPGWMIRDNGMSTMQTGEDARLWNASIWRYI